MKYSEIQGLKSKHVINAVHFLKGKGLPFGIFNILPFRTRLFPPGPGSLPTLHFRCVLAGRRTKDTGQVCLEVTAVPCLSCIGALWQFRALHPNVRLEVSWSRQIQTMREKSNSEMRDMSAIWSKRIFFGPDSQPDRAVGT